MFRLVKVAVLAACLAPALGGCLRPLYGAPEYGGLAVQNGLRGVKIEIAGERLAHYLRNELEFELRGGSPDSIAETHRLTINARQSVQAAIVERITGAAESATLQIDASYKLYAIGKPAVITEGDARVIVSYDRGQQRFASQRAARDAEIRGARQLAEQVRTRIASHLAAQR